MHNLFEKVHPQFGNNVNVIIIKSNPFIKGKIFAFLQTSETVSLDLLTYQDLEILRSKKSGGGGRGTSAANGLNSKRYLILTYTVEFDR